MYLKGVCLHLMRLVYEAIELMGQDWNVYLS